jgi:hypothetical protein
MVHGIAKLATAKRLPYESTADILKFTKFVIDESLPVQCRRVASRSRNEGSSIFILTPVLSSGRH